MTDMLTTNDPDRPLRLTNPGSQEWWYFDAISDDGRDAIVIVWYLGLPFDPRYGVAAIQHHQSPSQTPGPDPLDHCGVGISWYRDGKTIAYALNTYPRRLVKINDSPFSVVVGPAHLTRTDGSYLLSLVLPNLDGGKPITADLVFRTQAGNAPVECNLGGSHSPHHWFLAAADTRVEGTIELAAKEKKLAFRGRGYHDHNAGADELSLAWKRWGWDRVHFGPFTAIHYDAEPRQGARQTHDILCENSQAISWRQDSLPAMSDWKKSRLQIKFPAVVEYPGVVENGRTIPTIRRRHRHVVDSGPFYLRWVSEFEIEGFGSFTGISEHFEGDRLNSRWFNWMIPYRLKRPQGE